MKRQSNEDICKSTDCNAPAESLRDGRFLLTFTLFGPYGHRVIAGYCLKCGEKRIGETWVYLLYIIGALMLIVGLTQLPDWKPLLGISFIFSVWFGVIKWLRNQ